MMGVLNYLQRQYSDLLGKYGVGESVLRGFASTFPSSTLYYSTDVLSSEQLQDQLNSQLQDILALQYWLQDILTQADNLTDQLLRFVDQIYYTVKYQVHQKRQSDQLRFMPLIQDLQVLQPVHYYYVGGYVELTDQLVRIPSDGGSIAVVGVELPSWMGQIYSRAGEHFSLLYGGLQDTDEYDLAVVLPTKIECTRLYVLDKLGMLSIKDAAGASNIRTEDGVWIVEFTQQPRNTVQLRVKQHVLEPYIATGGILSIVNPKLVVSEKQTGVPVFGQLDLQLCFGDNFDGVQVYKTYQEYDIAVGVQNYEFSGGQLIVRDDVIFEPILLQR